MPDVDEVQKFVFPPFYLQSLTAVKATRANMALDALTVWDATNVLVSLGSRVGVVRSVSKHGFPKLHIPWFLPSKIGEPMVTARPTI